MTPCIVVIPALNPDGRLIDLAAELKSEALSVIIVNDGSGEDSLSVFSSLTEKGFTVLTHAENLGKGAALKTAFRYIEETYPDAAGCVTADADCQHSPEDIRRVAAEIYGQKRDCLILGTRDFSTSRNVPFRSRLGNRITSAVFFLQTGVKCADTQTGLRGIPRKYIPICERITGERYEYEINMLLFFAKERVPFVSLPIKTLYEKKNGGSHFRPLADSFIIYLEIIKFSLSSLFCSLIDLLLFWVSGKFFGIIISTILARLISGGLNFFLNKRIVFKNFGKKAKPYLLYAALFIFNMFMSGLLTSHISSLGLVKTAAKIIVDSALFVLGFFIQKLIVFREE